MDNLRFFCRKCLESARKFPVELLLGITFFVLYIVHSDVYKDNNHNVENVLIFFFPLFVLTYVCHILSTKYKGVQVTYWLSYLTFIPLFFIDAKLFIDSFAFGFTCLLAVFALFVGKQKMGNKSFATECLHTAVNLFLAALLGGMIITAYAMIWFSISYIFGIEETSAPIRYCVMFTLFIIIPILFVNFNNRNYNPEWGKSKLIHWILDFILSPSVIIYTVILYIYFIQIIYQWELPKGNIAYMVMTYVFISLLGILLQNLLQKHYYSWFYRYFTWYALPPLLLFWIGSSYRISLYSLTESRVYLLVAGILMTLFVFFLLFKRTYNYRSMLLIGCAAIIIFTFIPGISAHKIGIYAQTKRFESRINQLHLLDTKTHKFIENYNFDYKSLANDTIKGDCLAEISNIYSYLSHAQGEAVIKRMYGNWQFDTNVYQKSRKTNKKKITITLDNPIDISQYPYFYPHENYYVEEKDGQITVKSKNGNKLLMAYPITTILKAHPEILNESSIHPELLLTFHNDSLFFVLNHISIEKKDEAYIISNIYENSLFSHKKDNGITR